MSTPLKSTSANEHLTVHDEPHTPTRKAQAIFFTPDTSIKPQPFSFESRAAAKSPVKLAGKRRGHRYKHSSVSHQLIDPPSPRAPLALPASLQVPTLRECLHAMSGDQTRRLSWCGVHALVAAYTWWAGAGSLAFSALSHLLLFDAAGATLCVGVDIISNFEAWHRSSIRHPFGLERAEVLAGFAMAVFLLFMGGDVLKHCIEEGLEGHAHHRHAVQERVSPGIVHIAVLLALLTTLVSAIGLRNHERIGRAMAQSTGTLGNRAHIITLTFSLTLLLLPHVSARTYPWLDGGLSAAIAMGMCYMGVCLARSLGAMLLMGYARQLDISRFLADVEAAEPGVAVLDSRFWQVHHSLCMASLQVHLGGKGEAAAARLRAKTEQLARQVLNDKVKWEITTEVRM